jgi:hypothetical protein
MFRLSLNETETGRLAGIYNRKYSKCPWLKQEGYDILVVEGDADKFRVIHTSYKGEGSRSFAVSKSALEYILEQPENVKSFIKEVL